MILYDFMKKGVPSYERLLPNFKEDVVLCGQWSTWYHQSRWARFTWGNIIHGHFLSARPITTTTTTTTINTPPRSVTAAWRCGWVRACWCGQQSWGVVGRARETRSSQSVTQNLRTRSGILPDLLAFWAILSTTNYGLPTFASNWSELFSLLFSWQPHETC